MNGNSVSVTCRNKHEMVTVAVQCHVTVGINTEWHLNGSSISSNYWNKHEMAARRLFSFRQLQK